MKGKASMLPANRTLSALVVVCLLASGFAGFMVLVSPPLAKGQAIGDLIVDGTYTIEGILQPVDGNVIVNSGGHLIIRDATLSVISNYDPAQRHSVTVNAGGTLTLEHGTLTTYLDQIDPWPFLTLNVVGGTVEASGDSVLQFPGDIILSSNAQVTLNDTEIKALPSELIDAYVVGTSGLITADEADDGPSIDVTDSTVNLFDSSITDLPEFPVAFQLASNITLSGTSSLLAVNSYIGVDFGPVVVTEDWFTHNTMEITDYSHAYLYGCWFEPYSGSNADRVPAIVASATPQAPSVPSTKGAADNTGEPIANIQTQDGITYDVLAGETLEMDTWTVGSLSDSLPIVSAELRVVYTASPTYNGNQSIQWAVQGSAYASTGIVPRSSDPPGKDATYALPLSRVLTVGDVRNLNLRFAHNGAAGSVQFDVAQITFEVGADAFIYRWLNATVGDEYGVPIPGATISAVFTGSTNLEGREAFYYTPSGISATPPSAVLSYMGETALTYNVTKEDGRAVIPYLTDMILSGESGNPQYVGSYAFTGAKVIGTLYTSTSAFSLGAYPAMEYGDTSCDFTVRLPGVSAQSPDPARWLVVPPSLAIESMTYYHAGDVIVAADGTLWVNNSVFELVQAFPNQRTVYVDGTLTSPARLEIRGSQVVSTKPINIIVQGYGVLDVTDTVLSGVNIVALENSQVVFRNVTLKGNISTAYDSSASIKIFDSDLAEPTTLSGYVVGEYTNTSVPSIKVEDDAKAYIYRWIHVTVIDGAGYPAPGVTVSTRYFINNTPASSGVSDSQGVARVNSIGTIITEIGSTFVGNYRVNATLAHAGNYYYGASEISVGVMPYGEPLGRNVTYAVMTLPTAFPDLTLVGDALTVEPTNPKHGYDTYVNVTVSNVGPVPAHNVSAQFEDSAVIGGQVVLHPIGVATIPLVPVDGSAVISTRWTADPPLYPESHTISAKVDPDNTVPELVETTLIATKTVVVQNLSDVEVRSLVGEIYTVPSTVVVDTEATLCANVHNVGDLTTGDVLVEFYDQPYGTGSAVLVGTSVVTGIQSEHTALATVPWTPSVAGLHTIIVKVNNGTDPNPANHSFDELRFDNNQASLVFTVLTPPDLKLTNMVFSPSDRIPGGDLLTISATLTNTEAAPVSSVLVELRRDSPTGPLVDDKIVTAILSNNVTTVVSFGWVTPDVTAATDITFYMIVNPTQSDPEETTYSNNMVFGTVTVLDVRPDLVVTPSSINVRLGAGNVTASTFGRTVNVEVLVNNIGGRSATDFRVMVNVRNESTGYNHTFHSALYNISADAMNHTTLVSFEWKIRITNWGDYEIWVWVDSEQTISEPNEGNNIASTVFTINPLNAVIDINPDKAEYQAGDAIVVSLSIYYAGTSIVVPEVPNVVFRLVDTTTREPVPGSDTVAVNATADGTVVQTLTIPTDIDSGSYDIVAIFLGTTYVDDDATVDTVHISAAGAGGLLPMWLIIAIIVIVAAVIGGVSVYMYRYGLGKYVECGECGQFIPASSKRCPKCGVEFEVGTMKCSECGAWIPAESTECPNCGVKFVGEAEEEADYLERMRKEYDEMVSKYRELAKAELGKKFSDKAFEEWWKKQPGYITFEDWLAKEEEKKKEGPVPCPVCGTLNPKEATVCHKCGTVFGAVKEVPSKKGPPPAAPPAAPAPPKEVEKPVEGAPPAQEAAAPGAVAPRMVIRRPIEKKVVPKKIIRSPTGEAKEEGETKEDENQ